VENEQQSTVEEQTSSQTEAETTDSLHARAVGALAILRSFACTDQKRRKGQYVYRLLGKSSLKEGAM
jgi:hypothetical protein